jgi:riboflavin synthase
VLDVNESESWRTVRIGFEKMFRNLVVSKGSICVDGVSLTISNIGTLDEFWFEVSLIPATLENTTLEAIEVGSLVNIEFDQVGKYIAQNMQLQNER